MSSLLDPSNSFNENQANALFGKGKIGEAEEIYRRIVLSGEASHNVYLKLAIISGKRGDVDEMIEFLNLGLSIESNCPESHFLLGTALKVKDKINHAIDSFEKAIELNPKYPQAYFNLGNCQMHKGDFNKAIDLYHKAISINSKYPQAYFNMAKALIQKGDLEQAIDSYDRALLLDPSYIEALINLGTALIDYGDLKSAINTFNKALKIDSKSFLAYNNLGTALLENGDTIDAICSIKKAIIINSKYAEAYFNLGNAFHEKGEFFNSVRAYKMSLYIRPDYPSATFSLSLVELLLGDYDSGLKNFESRFMAKGFAVPHVIPDLGKWDGEVLSNDGKLIVVSEQGLGDTIQFMRYVKYLRDQKVKVVFCAQEALHGIIKSSKIDPSPVTPEEGRLLDEGKWISLLSLPKYLNVRPSNPLLNKPYIYTYNYLIEKWKNILSNHNKPIIGINWQGNPLTEKRTLKGRSMPLELFSMLDSENKVSFLSLQKGFGLFQLDSCSFRNKFVDSQEDINNNWDFLETSAIIANCKLIITTDTVIAHLAGGMGKETWLLLNNTPDWRWGINQINTFWYPSVRLFRQQQEGNWKEVVENISKQLRDRF